jgi:hypothetical protein
MTKIEGFRALSPKKRNHMGIYLGSLTRGPSPPRRGVSRCSFRGPSGRRPGSLDCCPVGQVLGGPGCGKCLCGENPGLTSIRLTLFVPGSKDARRSQRHTLSSDNALISQLLIPANPVKLASD